MLYRVESNRQNLETVQVGEAQVIDGVTHTTNYWIVHPLDESGWHLISSSRAGHQEYDNLTVAARAFELNCSLLRFINFCRVIDEDGYIHRYYNPALDERLPGSLGRLREKAYFLWEKFEEDDSVNFWLGAKQQIEVETSNLGPYFACSRGERATDKVDFTDEGDLVVP